jgi:predicted translin family RNA/ssDNA-binding protein
MDPYARTTRRLAAGMRRAEEAREEALRSARSATRSAAALIRGLHRGHWDAEEGRRLEGSAQALRVVARRHPFLAHHGAVLQALGEYVEAHLLRAHLDRRPPPPPGRLRVPAGAYYYGLADLVGELRRTTLSRLLQDDLAEAQRAFDSMEKVYEALVASPAPEPVLPLRAKVDASRAVVERTRGDLVTAKTAKDLEKKIDGVSRLLDEAEARPKRKPTRRPSDDLDLDAAWNKD